MHGDDCTSYVKRNKMEYETVGKIIYIAPEEQITENFKKKEFVIHEIEGQYQQEIKFEFVNNHTTYLAGYKVGDYVRVTFKVKGRKHKDSWFVNLQGVKLLKIK